MRKQSWEIGGMYAYHPKVVIHEVKNNNIDYLTFEILEDGIVTFTPSQEINILSWSFDNGSTWIEGNEIEVKKGNVVRCKGECVPTTDYGIGLFLTTCSYNLSGKTSSLLPVPVELTEEEVIDTIYAFVCGIYTMNMESSGEVALQATYPTFSKKDKVIAFFSDQGQLLSWELIVQQMSPVLMDSQEHLLQRSYNLIILDEGVSLMIPNYAELTPEEFFITYIKLLVPTATELDGIGVGLVIEMESYGASIGLEYCMLFYENSKLIDASKLTVDKFNDRGCIQMFKNCSSLKYPPLLPDPVKTQCYNAMFIGCTNLITAPELPATTLASHCYYCMFGGCTSLTAAPVLPATTLAKNCYYGMFNNCTSLTVAPVLPATTLADGCYWYMFENCTALTTAPVLPASVLTTYCYSRMFWGCKKLNKIKMLATNISASYCLDFWVHNVANNGTFIKHIDATWDTTKVIPTGWNVEYNFIPRKCNKLTITADDVLGRATYTKIYYTAEVEGLLDTGEPHIAICTGTDISKEFAKNMSTTEVVNRSIDYTYMGVAATTTIILDIYVDICDGYLTINALEDGLIVTLSSNSVEYCIDSDDNWVILAANTETPPINAGQTLSFRGHIIPNSTDGSGTFTINKQCNLTGNCNSLLFGDLAHKNHNLSKYTRAFTELFYQCTSIKNVSSKFLPATTLGKYCYDSMFNGCTSLVTTPELPATTSVTNCYRLMFRNCTSLTTAPNLPATTLTGYNCYQSMFEGCTSLTTAPELPATKLDSYCYDGMFSGCASLVTAPLLPTTTLSWCCYRLMFSGCTSLTTAPVLPATTLTNECYFKMFENCTKLNYIKMLATDISAQSCLSSWVVRVASTGTFIKHPDTEIPTGTSGIPEGWEVETIDI